MPGPPQSINMINIPAFVSHINVALIGLFALYVIWTLPRVLVLFQHSEILNGFFLRSTYVTAPRATSQYQYDMRGSSGAIKMKPIHSTNTLTSPMMPVLVDLPKSGVGGRKSKSSEAQRPALIIPTCSAAAADAKGFSTHRFAPSPRRKRTCVPNSSWMRILLPTLAYAFNFRVAPGISFGNLLVVLVYAALMLYACLRSPNPLVNPQRLGYLAISQVPIVVALAGRTNWLGLACGLGYEKVCVFALKWLGYSESSMVAKLHSPLCGACYRHHS